MKGKKGAGVSAASDVSILIVIIGLLVVTYIIMLPPAEREELLGDALDLEEEDGIAVASAKVLLSASPGEVYTYSTNVQTISLEPVHVYKKDTTSTDVLVKGLYVNRNFVQNGYKEIFFDMEDVDELKSLKLLMLVSEAKGPLAVEFNDRMVYEGQLTSAQMPITLPLDEVKESNNKLKLYIPMPWWHITSSYYYSLDDVSLIKESSEEKSSAVRTFLVDRDIADQVNTAELRYYIGCNTVDDHGRLTVSFNKRDVYSDTIFCQYTDERVVPLPRTMFRGRESHSLEFSVDKGDYNIDEPRLKVKLARSTYPTYVFEMDSELWDKISAEDAEVNLYFKFKDDGSRKKARMLVQDREFAFDTIKGTYSKDITSMLDDGSNVIKIIPQSNFEINNLKVYWE